jgi:hypothetical protein
MADDFWNLSDAPAGGTFEAGGGEIKPIPADTNALAVLDEAKWAKDQENNSYVSLRWSVLQPAEYKNRKVFQKLWVKDPDPKAADPAKKKDKALRMLAAIDFNAGGHLRAAGGEPTDAQLASSLCAKPMIIKVMIWELTDKMTGETKVGNWVGAVSPKKTIERAEDAPF